MAHPAILRDLVEQYTVLRILHAEQETFETRRRLEDLTYTLCVSTGTRLVEDALAVAERQLAAALADTARTSDSAAAPRTRAGAGASDRLVALTA